MDIGYKLELLFWMIFLFSLSVTLCNLWRGTEKITEWRIQGLFWGMELLNENNIGKKLLKEPFRYHQVCSQTNITGSWRPLDLILSNAFNTILQLSESKRAIRIRRSWQVQTWMCNSEIFWLENAFSHWEQCNIIYFQDVRVEVLAAECLMQFCKNRLKWNEVLQVMLVQLDKCTWFLDFYLFCTREENGHLRNFHLYCMRGFFLKTFYSATVHLLTVA